MEKIEEKTMIPRDPQILCSFINTKLRDDKVDLDTLCKDLNIDKNDLIKKLTSIEYVYNKEENRFI